jgi:hypothetical protein
MDARPDAAAPPPTGQPARAGSRAEITRQAVVEAKARRNRWLLVEAFSGDGRQPPVIANGRNAICMVPLGSVMSKSRYAEEVRVLALRAASEGTPLQVAVGCATAAPGVTTARLPTRRPLSHLAQLALADEAG